MTTKKRPKGFVPIPNFMVPIPLKRLQPIDKILYAKMLSLMNNRTNGYCYASNATLAEYVGVSGSTVKRALKRLSAGEYIYIHTYRATDKGQYTSRREIYPLFDKQGDPLNQAIVSRLREDTKQGSQLVPASENQKQGSVLTPASGKQGSQLIQGQGSVLTLGGGSQLIHQLDKYYLEEGELDKSLVIKDTDNEMHPAQLTEWEKPKSATNYPANSDQQEDGGRDALPPFLKEEPPKSVQQEEQKPITVTDFLSTFDTYKQGRYDAWRNDFGDRIVSAELEGMVKRINNGAKIDRPFNYLNTIFQRMGESGLVTDWESYREYKEEYYRQLGIEQYYERP